jgi:hypothetical protein
MKPGGSSLYPQQPATCPYPEPDQSNLCPHPNSRRFILILSSHLCLGLSSGLLPSDFPTKALYAPLPHLTGLDRPLGLQEVETPRLSRPSAHEGGKAVSPTHRPPLPPPPPRPQERSLVLIFVIGWDVPRAIMWLEGLYYSTTARFTANIVSFTRRTCVSLTFLVAVLQDRNMEYHSYIFICNHVCLFHNYCSASQNVAGFTPRQHFPRGKIPRYPLSRGSGGPKAGLGVL